MYTLFILLEHGFLQSASAFLFSSPASSSSKIVDELVAVGRCDFTPVQISSQSIKKYDISSRQHRGSSNRAPPTKPPPSFDQLFVSNSILTFFDFAEIFIVAVGRCELPPVKISAKSVKRFDHNSRRRQGPSSLPPPGISSPNFDHFRTSKIQP